MKGFPERTEEVSEAAVKIKRFVNIIGEIIMSEMNLLAKWKFFKKELVELVFLFDENGIMSDCSTSARERLGYAKDEKLKMFSEIFPALTLEASNNLYSTEIYRKNETCFPADVKIKSMPERGYAVFAVDRTDMSAVQKAVQNLNDELETSDRYKTEFVSNITHELRTPVNGIQGMAKKLLSTELTPKQAETIRVIDNCCANMSKIINNLLDFSKMEANKLELENKPFMFRDFLNKAMAFNVNLVNDKGLKLIMHVGEDIPEQLVGDELRLTQILNNLISNAVKFTSAGHVVLKVTLTREEDDMVELFFMVMDTGIGIEKENIDKLFKSFSQVDASITRRFGGTGLGLSICKKLVTMMGGDIKVESEEGKGSIFSFNVLLNKAENSGEQLNVKFPSGSFIYEGSGLYKGADEETGLSERGRRFAIGMDKLYKFTTNGNAVEIKNAMDKLILCIELENWEKAENFSSVIKNLISDDEIDKELKKAAFRLELIIRREDKEKAILQYNIFKDKFTELHPSEV